VRNSQNNYNNKRGGECHFELSENVKVLSKVCGEHAGNDRRSNLLVNILAAVGEDVVLFL
jgi:hypothetical protein